MHEHEHAHTHEHARETTAAAADMTMRPTRIVPPAAERWAYSAHKITKREEAV